jgi:Asp-tRNA(Asn)/Glu-tRNA(Gln) amidotransferase A subunit family amidase
LAWPGRDLAIDAGAAADVDDRSSGRSAPMLNGLPVPAKDDTAVSGILSSHSDS